MAYRQIHTQIWKDEWFLDLEPDEKLLFIYLFSNDNTTLAGIYKISIKVIAFETGLELSRIKEILAKFSQTEKVFYQDGLMWVVNLMRYNASSNSPKVQIRIKRELEAIPDCPLKIRYQGGNIPYPYPMDTISLINSNSNSNSNSNNNINNNSNNGTAAAVFQAYESEIGILTPAISDKIDGIIDDYPEGWIIEAISEASKNNVRKLPYIEAILKSWKTNGKKAKKKDEPIDPESMASEVYQ